ncbi:hypothetical protein D3Y59_06805 [Hymenobacter oligotrophus]|uniref:Uncharacterized protein n=1 Tax=Hymenobacter oligotrophus TaxID=2319843 RepID=A0A3B7R5Z7_9BACT|nr:hypothetical protein [Hymenobacter oligotrophus]AYA36791.1 hypothetical protein D3Y59_06805 [Hymenobacter oligotrophus]
MGNRYTLRAVAEADGPVVSLVLVTLGNDHPDVWEMDLPYLLWESMGTRAASQLVARIFRERHPLAARLLGSCHVHRIITNALQQHSTERVR